MELTRRDALAALSVAGVGSVGGCSTSLGGGSASENVTDEDPVSAHDVETMVALADVLYPSAVTGVAQFVRDYSVERVRDDPAYGRGVVAAVDDLDDYVAEWYDGPYAELSTAERGDVLDQMTVDTADPGP